MRTANPALNSKTFSDFPNVSSSTGTMTLKGTADKTGVLLVLTFLAASWSWSRYFSSWDSASIMPTMWIGLIGGLIFSMITIFNKPIARITAPLYAIFEGLFLGAISAIFEARYKGIVLNAVFLTFGTFASLLFLYRTGKIRATENFKLGIVSATGGIALLYLVSFILGMFNVQIPMIHSSGIFGIGFSLFVVVIAALNLVLDFDFIENGVKHGAPKYMEWYSAFGLLVTLVWLYIEILRLLAKLADRR